MQLLLSRAGLVLNPGQVADLVLAWRQVAGLIGLLPRDRPLADDMALGFRLPLPSGADAAAPAARPKAPASRKKSASPVRRSRSVKPKKKAAPVKKGASKRAVAKAAPRKKVRRGR